MPITKTEPERNNETTLWDISRYRKGDHYKIKGTKVFISWGEHDLTDNILHLVLARIDGAPEGAKGISLFVVPNIRVHDAGRKPGSVAIIDSPDIRRMLLWMKAMVDGMRSMIYTGAYWADLALELPDGAEKDHYQNLEDFTTPIINAYCSDMGFRVCETAVQCLGGYGFCSDYPLE